jgi:uncharacterized RDD family membrane protein YckC
MSGRAAVTSELASPDRLPTAALSRRMACLLYDGVLLVGVLMAAGLAYALVTGQRNAMAGRLGLQAFLFVVLGVYFTWFWSRGGQTVAMKAWRIRVLCADGTPLSLTRALARYAAAWLWFVPALFVLWLAGAPSTGGILTALAVGVLGYAALTRLNPDRQFWHDVACGTRLVNWRLEATRPNRT